MSLNAFKTVINFIGSSNSWPILVRTHDSWIKLEPQYRKNVIGHQADTSSNDLQIYQYPVRTSGLSKVTLHCLLTDQIGILRSSGGEKTRKAGENLTEIANLNVMLSSGTEPEIPEARDTLPLHHS